MAGRKALPIIILLISAVLVPNAAAQDVTYLAMSPDTQFCISVIFGDHGRGEYTLTIDDPAYPGAGWVDTHRTSFTSGSLNPVIIPVCFSTKGRRIGDEALLRFTLETPEEEMIFHYGVCVSKQEDADVAESSYNPCDAASSHTDLFAFDLAESEKFSLTGEKVTFKLLLSSEFDLTLSLDKDSGPVMNITSTRVTTPGEHSIDIVIDSPREPGDYAFTVTAKADDCSYPSCEKRVSGVLHVSPSTGQQGFRVELSPKNKNVVGMQAAAFFLTIHNFEAEQTFNLDVDFDSNLKSNFIPLAVKVGKDKSRQIEFTVVPQSSDHKLYMISAAVQGEIGGRKTAESFLTIEEPVADIQRKVESDPSLKDDADDYADKYGAEPSIDDWKDVQGIGDDDDDDEIDPTVQPAPPVNWVMIVAAVAAIGLIALYIYKKTRVVSEIEELSTGY